MNSGLLTAAIVASLGLPAVGHAAMNAAQYNAEKERIGDAFESARLKCESFGGNAKDICLAEARGDYQVASAELAERRSPSSRTRYRLRLAMAEAEYGVAAEECDEGTSAAKDACLAEAKATLTRDKATATRRHDPR